MAVYIFVSLQNDDLISRFDISRGVPESRLDFSVSGGPAPMTMNPQKTRLFVGMRKSNELVCLRIGGDAALSLAARVSLPSDPCFVGMDHGGRYVFSSYYKAGQVAVHRWDETNDAMTETQRVDTEPKAHSVWLDPGDRYVYVPHTGPNKIYLYEFESSAGVLKARTPPWLTPEGHLEPRHLCFHPVLDRLYAINERSSTLSVYDCDRKDGSLKHRQTVSTLPAAGIEGNLTAEIHVSPDGRFLYASNRGHNTIACFAVDGDTGSVKLMDYTPVPAVPRSFDFSPDGRFLYAAGLDTGELAAFELDRDSGRLAEFSRMFIGNSHMWVMSASL